MEFRKLITVLAKSSVVMPVLVFVLAMLAAAPAEAAGPFILKVPVDFTDTFNGCGFTIVHHTEGFFTIHVFFDRNGNPRMEIDTLSLKETLTNPATGVSLFTPDVEADIGTFQQDGSSTLAVVGLLGHIVIKGQGEIAAQVGRIVFKLDAAGNLIGVVFEAGQRDDFVPAVCSALG
jgi:hypothetical protein